MKMMTLNTHSLQEVNCGDQLDRFVEGILRERPDIIAMQEVNQTACEAAMPPEMLEGQYQIPGCTRIRKDNYAANVAHRLRLCGIECYWVWVPIKLGYNKYDEGVAVLSLGRKIRCIDCFPISKVNDYYNWRTRFALGVQVEGLNDWFYTVHMGWWDDPEECFLDQWKVLNCCIASKRMYTTVWLLGDFNAPDVIPGQSYEHITAWGWLDTYKLAGSKGCRNTVPGVIDGWQERAALNAADGMCLDYILCNKKRPILSSQVVFNGRHGQVVSDHYGVMIETVA